jgi:hypothetical protein
MKSFYCFNFRILTFAVLAVLALASCDPTDPIEPQVKFDAPTNTYSAEVALAWNEMYLDLERYTSGYRPPVSARASAYIGLTAYEAVYPGMSDKYNSFGDYYAGLDLPDATGMKLHYPTALNAAYEQIFKDLFPTAPADLQFKMTQLADRLAAKFALEVPFEDGVRSRKFGVEVAKAVFEWSATDKRGHKGYEKNNSPTYVPPKGVGKWQPTFPDYTPALLPFWGEARCFAADDTDIIPDPLPYGESADNPLYQQGKVVEELVNEIKAGGKKEDYWIADFWSDDCPILTFTPAGRWVAVANQIVVNEKVSLDKAVETYARVGMAICDAGIRAWREKYRHSVERPIDYIRRVMGDENWNTIMCPDGSGKYFTPPFPAYPSGHATFGAAAAAVLSDLYGTNYRMTDRCHEGRTEFISTPRTFDSFVEMAEENAYSRIPIGVHFEMDATTGLDLGYGIGDKVNKLPWKK